MALNKRFTFPADVTLTGEFGVVKNGSKLLDVNAYIKVATIEGSKDLLTLSVTLSDGPIVLHRQHSFAPDLKGENFIKQAYLYLKTLPEFADAVDC